jgi:hypothetical protein
MLLGSNKEVTRCRKSWREARRIILKKDRVKGFVCLSIEGNYRSL